RVLAEKAQSTPPPLREWVPTMPDRLGAMVAALLQPDPARRPDAQAVLREIRTLRPETTGWRAQRALQAVSEAQFVGRTAELETLRAAFAETRHGKTVTVQLSGPSGIGKTELVRRFLGEVDRDGETWVLRSRCHPQESVPYKAFDGL